MTIRRTILLVLGVSMFTMAVSCSTSSFERCAAIPAGTPTSSLPLVGRSGYVEGSPITPTELLALQCCYPIFRDGGICPGEFDCAQVQPAELVRIGGQYAGDDCGMGGQWACSAWVRDGGVLAAWNFCPD
ncbi:MAG TPA: hypothetical protein VGF41_11055 [Myxococcaceae bacterium]